LLDVAVKGGVVVTPEAVARLDVGIRDGRIAVLAAEGGLPDATQIVDATGKLVVPGGIDPHVHCNLEGPAGGEESVSAGSDVVGQAAVCGGTTTVIDFVWVGPGEGLIEGIERLKRVWEHNSPCDYSFHIVLRGEFGDNHLEEIPDVISAGFPSFKIFTTNVFPHAVIGGVSLKAEMGSLRELFALTTRHSGLTEIGRASCRERV